MNLFDNLQSQRRTWHMI